MACNVRDNPMTKKVEFVQGKPASNDHSYNPTRIFLEPVRHGMIPCRQHTFFDLMEQAVTAVKRQYPE